MTIQAVLFDADGVLIFPWRFALHLSSEHAITPDMTLPFFRGPFEQCLLGTADLKKVLPPYLAEWGWRSSVDEFIALWLETDHAVDERVAQLVRALRGAGYVCGLATSQERYRATYMRDSMGFGQLFDYLFFSCDIGYRKPDPLYFGTVEKSLGLKREKMLFFDDDPHNVAAARARGWRAEVADEDIRT